MRNILPKSLFYILASCKWKLKDNYLLCLLNFLSLYIYLPKSNVLDLARCQVLLFFPLVLVYYFLLSSSQQLSIANSSSVGHRTSWPFPGFFFYVEALYDLSLCGSCAWCHNLCECEHRHMCKCPSISGKHGFLVCHF